MLAAFLRLAGLTAICQVRIRKMARLAPDSARAILATQTPRVSECCSIYLAPRDESPFICQRSAQCLGVPARLERMRYRALRGQVAWTRRASLCDKLWPACLHGILRAAGRHPIDLNPNALAAMGSPNMMDPQVSAYMQQQSVR